MTDWFGMTEWVAVVIALGAFLVAAMSYVSSAATVRVQVYLDLRRNFSALKGSIPLWYSEARIPPDASPDQIRACELYWQNAFDEWFVTTRLEPWHLRRLWKRFYAGTFTLALSHGALREVVAKLTHDGAEFGDHQEVFRESLNKLCLQAYKVPLCGNGACARCTGAGRATGR